MVLTDGDIINKKYLHLYTYDSSEYIPAMKLYEKYNFVIYDRDNKVIYYKLHLKVITNED